MLNSLQDKRPKIVLTYQIKKFVAAVGHGIQHEHKWLMLQAQVVNDNASITLR